MAISEADVIAVLPPDGFVTRLCEWSGATCDGSIVYALGSAITALSILVPPHVTIEFGTTISALNWGIMVGDSGSRKTAVANKCLSIVREVLPDRVGSSHESAASLLESFAERPQQLLVDTEMGNFLASTRTGSYKSDIQERLMDMWDGHTVSKTSLKGGSFEVHNPRPSWLACVAPELIEKHTTETQWTGGFFSRFLVFLANPRERKLTPPPSWPEMRRYLVDLYRHLSTRNIGECVGFTDEAAQMLKDWDNRMEAIYGSTGEQRHLVGVYSRLTVLACKVAMAYSVDFGAAGQSNGYPWKIGATELRYAIYVAEMHMKGAVALVGQLALSPFERNRRAVLEAVGTGSTLQGILGRCKPKMLKRPTVEVLETLEAEGILVKRIEPTHGMIWEPVSLQSPAAVGDDGRPLALFGAYTGAATEPQVELPPDIEQAPDLSNVVPLVRPTPAPAQPHIVPQPLRQVYSFDD